MLIPRPAKQLLESSFFSFAPPHWLKQLYDKKAQPAADLLKKRLEESRIVQFKEKEGNQTLRWVTQEGLVGHHITVTPSYINIHASDEQDFHEAGATLFQLFFLGKKEIRCQKIEDYPRYAWRGFLFDCVRHFFPLRFLFKIVELLSILKINVLHLHFCDDQGWRIDFPDFPLLREKASWRQEGDRVHGGFYSQGEIKQLVNYAKERGVSIIPEYELPGHCSAALYAYPRWSLGKAPSEVPNSWGIFDSVYNIADESVKKDMEKIIDDIISLFPSPYIHIGGDEVSDKSLKKLSATTTDLHSLFTSFYTRITDHIISSGKTPIVWDEALSYVSSKVMAMIWRSESYAKMAVEKGHSVILMPQDGGCYLDHKHSNATHELGRISVSGIEQTATHQFPDIDIKGVQAAMWTEGTHAEWEVEQMIFPRLSILSQRFWQHSPPPLEG